MCSGLSASGTQAGPAIDLLFPVWPGVAREALDDSFWKRRRYTPHPDDVVLRTSEPLKLYGSNSGPSSG